MSSPSISVEQLANSIRRDIRKCELETNAISLANEKRNLLLENESLRQLINQSIAKLCVAEMMQGKKQIPLPDVGFNLHVILTDSHPTSDCTVQPVTKVLTNVSVDVVKGPIINETKSKKDTVMDKNCGESKKINAGSVDRGDADAEATKNRIVDKSGGGTVKSKLKPADDSAAVDVSRLDLRIGKIVDVERHPDADSLYVEKVDIGNGETRTVISGLVSHVTLEEMQNRRAVFLCNLKPAKMRGITSEGMLMCASSNGQVEILQPPEASQPGDLVEVEGYDINPDPQLNPKKKIFETLKPDLFLDQEGFACYKTNKWFVRGKGYVKAPTKTNAQIS